MIKRILTAGVVAATMATAASAQSANEAPVIVGETVSSQAGSFGLAALGTTGAIVAGTFVVLGVAAAAGGGGNSSPTTR